MSLSTVLGRVARRIARRQDRAAAPDVQWQDIERFEDDWTVRISEMAKFISSEDTVVDFGCGPMWLKRYIDASKYIPVDYVDRGAGTIVCDLNRDPYPDVHADLAFVSGCLEYVDNPDAFVGYLGKHFRKCVLSYCTTDAFPDLAQRRNLAWRNHFSRESLLALFAAKGYVLTDTAETRTNNSIFVFARAAGTLA